MRTLAIVSVVSLAGCGSSTKSGGDSATDGNAISTNSETGSKTNGSTSSASGNTDSTSANSGSSTGGSPSTDGSSSTTSNSNGGSGATTSSADDLSGTWDVIVSNSDGDAATATVTLSATLLEVVGDDVHLLTIIGDQQIDIAYDDHAVDATRQSPSDLDLGIMPLPLAGALHFAGPADGGTCDTSLQADSFTMTCTDGVRGPRELLRLDNTNASATKSEALSSVFGDLGGSWSYQDDSATCSAVFERDTITVSCSGSRRYTGDLTVTIDGDRISGATNGGLEFTAQRR